MLNVMRPTPTPTHAHNSNRLQATIRAEIEVLKLSDDEAALVDEFARLDYLDRSLANLHVTPS